MIYYDRKNKGLLIRETWFSASRNEDLENDCDIICYYNLPQRIQEDHMLMEQKNGLTLLNDLTKSEDEQLQGFESNVRYEVRRSMREHVTCEIYDSKKLDCMPRLFEHFDEEYQKMYRKKDIFADSVKAKLLLLQNYRMVLLSFCRFEDKILAYHTYISDRNTARLLHSVSMFRNEDDQKERGFIGRANRLLHFMDMLSLKKEGYKVYDWGGYSKEPALQGINKFKSGFGGTLTEVYYGKLVCSTKGYFAWKINTLIKQFNRNNI